MAYADHSEASSRTISIIIVALIHVVLGYAFVSGLGMKYVKKAAEQLNVIDVKEEPPPPDEPPPPPPKPADVPPPPVVAPPPIVKTTVVAPVVETAPRPVPVAVPIPTPAPPPPRPATKASPRGNPGSWVTSDDYPSRALREERSGTVGVRIDIGTDGKATNCTVTSSSGHGDLDAEACRLLMRRARFKPAVGTDGNPMTDTFSSRFVWRIPE